jgi:Fur family ferric uptake transcriptional regulator
MVTMFSGREGARGRMTESPTRVTRQRVAVRALLMEVGEFRSAQDLHDLLRSRGTKVSLTTVYRTLEVLVEAGEVDMMRLPNGESLFRRCSKGHHHHHLVCRSCGKAVEIEGAAFEDWAERIASDHGFTEVDHTVEIFGRCPACAGAG